MFHSADCQKTRLSYVEIICSYFMQMNEAISQKQFSVDDHAADAAIILWSGIRVDVEWSSGN
ncbi:MAG: hypothetical protein ACR2PS_09295 [Pseudomonadales bacterium]